MASSSSEGQTQARVVDNSLSGHDLSQMGVGDLTAANVASCILVPMKNTIKFSFNILCKNDF